MARKSKAKGKAQAKPAAQLPAAPLRHAMEVATLSRAIETTFDVDPDKAMLERIAAFMQVETVKALRFKGELQPRRKDEWQLEARLTAHVEQACVVTLTSVPERIDAKIMLELLPISKASESETLDISPEDDDDGPDYFEDEIDLGAIALEQLALALEPYPRAGDAILEDGQFAAPGVQPLRDDDLKPFASLADLKAKLSKGS